MANKYTTKKPTGLSIVRNGNNLVVSWKIGDKDYGAGQTFQWRLPSKAWQTVTVGNGTTKKVIAVPVANYCPNTSKPLAKVMVRIRGKRSPFNSITPAVSEWATSEFDILYPNRPSVTSALSSSNNNVCTFSWTTVTGTNSKKWFSVVQCQTCLLTNSTITDGSKIPARSWTAHAGSAANGSATITEDTSVINNGQSHTRWFRVRSRGPQGSSAWAYSRHVYSVPYQTKSVKASAKTTDAGGYLCKVTWQTPRSAAHPVDSINVQYTLTTPAAGMTCPDGASWTDGETLAYKDGSDASAFSVDNVVGTDQCLFVRINTVHDRNTTYGYAVVAAVGQLTAPTGVSVSTDTSTHRATITATNGSSVADSFMAVKYMTEEDPNGFVIGIIPHGQTSVTVQCPTFSSTSNIKFGVFAVVGSYTATTRADGASSYAVKAQMKSDVVTYGGTVPAAPTSVTLSRTATAGTVRVTFGWAWQSATSAELSWADHEDAWESTDEPSTYMINNTHASAWNISGLEVGKTWYIRVRLANGDGNETTYGAYSDIQSIDLSSAPAIPVLTLSASVITEDVNVTASWTFVSPDGTGQAFAEVAEYDGTDYTTLATVESAQHVTISARDAGWQTGESHRLAVRVTSASGKQSDGWSDPVAVTIAEPLTATITASSLVEQTITDDGNSRTVKSLTEMPLTATVTGAGAGGTTTLIIERAETYHITRPDETDINGFEGETVAIFSQTGEAQISISNDDLIGHLDDGAPYRLIATVQDGLGQSAEITQDFEVHWAHQALIPTATVILDNTNLIARLTPVAPENALATDVCDIYRLSADKPELIYPNAVFGTEYVDPYPTLGEHGGHRFVFKTANGDYITASDELAWADYEGGIDSEFNIIDFGTGRVLLQYNTNLTHTWKKDFIETKYLGGSIQGDWNPAVSRNGTLAATVTASDSETIESMRRLAAYPGICHVRTKDGSSYAADVQVGETQSQDTAHNLVVFSLTITRVDPETYDGITYAEWQQTGG